MAKLDFTNLDNTLRIQSEVRTVLNSYFGNNVIERNEYFLFRCNVCGDSHTDSNKKRGYILKKYKPWRYYCHNCRASFSVVSWLKRFYTSNYDDMVRDMLMNLPVQESVYSNIHTNNDEYDPAEEKYITKTFKRITKYPDVVQYCIDRGIPEDVYTKWFYADDGYMYENKFKVGFKQRLIIPFYNADGDIYYYQGRALHKWQMPKYKSRKTGNNIYNYYLVDKNKPVIVLEGPIDSIFVENSIATTGLKFNDEKLSVFPNKKFLQDNDPSGNKVAAKLLDSGMYVFNWQLFLREYECSKEIKDVNDFIRYNKHGINKLSLGMMDRYFTNRIYDKIFFLKQR